jgi:pimeloyl-ACP methyl ester carboxylesterase
MARQQGMTQIADTVAQGSVSDAADMRNPLCRVYVRESLMRQNPHGYAMHCEALADAKAAEHGKIVCPVRLIVGDQDPVTPFTSAQKLQESLSNANLHTLKNTGHWATIEAAEQSAGLLREHLSGL